MLELEEPQPNHRKVDRLIFVYQADAGMVNALMESAKKLLMVQGCALCEITHGVLGEKASWRSCREEIGVPIEGFHRNELPDSLQPVVGDCFPCVVAEAGGEAHLLLNPEALAGCRGSVTDFRVRLRSRAMMHGMVIPGWENSESTERGIG